MDDYTAILIASMVVLMALLLVFLMTYKKALEILKRL